MRIKEDTLRRINMSITDDLPETGGILGSSSGSFIDIFTADTPYTALTGRCRYEPNVEFLNEEISRWQQNQIEFMGVYHTHFADVETLSQADKEYIEAIMRAMPEDKDMLFFPVFVLPQRNMIGYKAQIDNGTVIITPEDITVERQ